jgi:hypothetical protein
MTKKNKPKLKVMVSKIRINKTPKSKKTLRIPKHLESLRILHLTLVSKKVDP